MDETHTRIVGNERHVWYTKNLWKHARQLTPAVVAIDSIPEVDINCWFEAREPSLREIAKHAKRIEEADLSFPIILNADGALMDGGHRICKAITMGHTTVFAVRFTQTPEPDERVPVAGKSQYD